MNVQNAAAPVGAEIIGMDLAQPLGEDAFRAIEDVFHDRGVIVFRDQQLTEDQHIAFSRRFGELEIHVAKHYLKPDHPEILVLSNIIENGRHVGLHDAGQYWHSDFSFVANPSRCSLLYALEVPTQGGRVLGETLFASAVHAYDTLPDHLQARLQGVRAIHRYADRYRKLEETVGREQLSAEQLKRVPDVCHNVIRAHPRTGRRVLFVNEGFTVSIEGMTNTDSDSLLQELFAHIGRQEMIYAHQWRAGDLLMWDNCLVQHRAARNYELPLRRLMHRTTVAGP
jgi:alpha-ketoglutarate-dependent taurine dioxygenase